MPKPMTPQMLDVKEKLSRFFQVQGKSKIHENGVVDVEGNVRLTSLWPKMPVQFGKVSGFFLCSDKNLTTLAGCPQYVGDNFDCSSNMLTSLEFAPMHVGKNYKCANNQLTSLLHVPEKITGTFNCSKNQLVNLTHAPTHVQDDMSCYHNPFLNLDGAPTHVGRSWWLTYDAHLPLLRTLVGSKMEFMNMNPESDQVAEILNKHMGQGKAGAIKAAVELVRAGFKENARW